MRKNRTVLFLLILAAALAFVACGGGSDVGIPASHPEIALISNNTNGIGGNDYSQFPSISNDGSYVVFESDATNLVEGDTNGAGDIFLRDTQTGTVSLISNAANGTESDGTSYGASINADGRYVAFYSAATNLVDGDTNGTLDIFVRDTQAGTVSIISNAADGTEGDGTSFTHRQAISADGRYVAFVSFAATLVDVDTNSTLDVFVRDTQAGTVSLISNAADGTEGNSAAGYPVISADGRYVAFYSAATNLVDGDTNGAGDIFLRDTQTGTVSLISNAADGTESDGESAYPTLSADGRYVAFVSFAATLVDVDTNSTLDVFVRDTQAGTVTLISNAASGTEADGDSDIPSISGNGQYVAFRSAATNLVAGDTNAKKDIFVRDTLTGTVKLISAAYGSQSDGNSSLPAISSDGAYVAFDSLATNLIDGGSSSLSNVYIVPIE